MIKIVSRMYALLVMRELCPHSRSSGSPLVVGGRRQLIWNSVLLKSEYSILIRKYCA